MMAAGPTRMARECGRVHRMVRATRSAGWEGDGATPRTRRAEPAEVAQRNSMRRVVASVSAHRGEAVHDAFGENVARPVIVYGRFRAAQRSPSFIPARRQRSFAVKRRIEGSTVVVVGATSGVGRATARSLAASGAQVVIAARSRSDVGAVVTECRHFGAQAVGVVADNGNPDDVDRIAQTACEHFGSIDTWINTAAELVVGELDCLEPQDIRRVVSTNVVGTALASRAAMHHFKDRNAGVLVNVSSLLGVIPNPIVPTYVMTKFAVRGLTLSLHQSTRGRRSKVRVCVILPGPIDTPMFANALNRTGRAIRAIPPAQSPERVAAAVLRSVRRPHRQRTTGLTGALIVVGMHVLPRFTETVVAQLAARLIFRPGVGAQRCDVRPRVSRRGSADGGWRRFHLRVVTGDAVGRWLARGRTSMAP